MWGFGVYLGHDSARLTSVLCLFVSKKRPELTERQGIEFPFDRGSSLGS